MTNNADSTDRAIYYPNRLGIHEVKVLGKRILATNDFGTACYEQRSFIDMDTLMSLEGGSELVVQCIDPHPPCTTITGHGDWREQRIVGMLSESLRVKWVAPTSGATIILMLPHVLIIDKLPVPLHIGLKAFEGTSVSNNDAYWDMVNSSMNRAIAMVMESFPPSFHSHPFWFVDLNVHFLGITQQRERTTELLSGQLPPPSLNVRQCVVCQSRARTFVCSRCRAVSYCGTEHQAVHWPTHRAQCRPREA